MMWSRALAGLLPGFFAAAGVLALLTWALPGPWQSTLAPGLLGFFPLWTAAFITAFGLRSPRRAWGWLSAVALLSFALTAGLRWLGWVQ